MEWHTQRRIRRESGLAKLRRHSCKERTCCSTGSRWCLKQMGPSWSSIGWSLLVECCGSWRTSERIGHHLHLRNHLNRSRHDFTFLSFNGCRTLAFSFWYLWSSFGTYAWEDYCKHHWRKWNQNQCFCLQLGMTFHEWLSGFIYSCLRSNSIHNSWHPMTYF